MKNPSKEISGIAFTVVNTSNTARTVKSGSLEVFATPALLALMEEATCVAISQILDENESTVGTGVKITHTRASAIGEVITATAILVDIDDRMLTFRVIAKNESDATVGTGEIKRCVVDSQRFMEKVKKQ